MGAVGESLDSKKAILASARALFSEKGFSGASVSAIAAHAGVTKSLVMYHWATKEQLWHDVVAEALDPYMAVIQRFGERDPNVSLQDLITSVVAMHGDHPDISRMWSWMGLDRRILIDEKKVCQGRLAIQRANEEADAFGLPEGIRPVMAIAVMMAAVDGWFAFREQMSSILGIETSTPEATAEFSAALLKICFPHYEGK
jgi:TetR/AcrR family transcriptional regulator